MRVFLSSTYEDLIEYRAKAAHAVERLGQQGVRMEVFGARPASATVASLQEVESSDAFIGIYAHRYGSILPGAELSIIEQEFDCALAHQKPIFCFLIDENYPWLPRYIDSEPMQTKLEAFKKKIVTDVVRDTFTTPEDLAYKVAASLGHFLITKQVKEELEHADATIFMSTEQGRNQVARRAARLQPILKGARVLLVNDVPSEMDRVTAILRGLGVEVTIVPTSDEALSQLAQVSFEVVVSDMRRGQAPDW